MVERLPWNGVETWLKESWDQFYVVWYTDWGLILSAVGLAVLMTVLRLILNFALFHVSTCGIVY